MLINTDLPTENTLANLQNQLLEAGSNAPQTSPTASNDSAASQVDPSLQRLTDLPTEVQDADWEIQDEQEAGRTVESLRQGMLGQSGAAMGAQANQLPANVLSLLQ